MVTNVKEEITIEGECLEVLFDYDYDPGCMYDSNMTGYPASMDVEIISIKWRGVDVTDLVMSIYNIDEIESKAVENMA